MKNKLLILVLCISGCLASCDKWLEINPKNEIASEQLFATGIGYRNALNGIFQECGKPSLYGKSLSWGALSAVTQTYDKVTTKDEIYYYKEFEYDYNSSMTGTYSGWWSGMYNIIANINNLLANIENANPDMFDRGEYEKNLITGEALAMRAFLHLDIVRLFAPAPVKNKNFKMIPYHDTYPSKFTMPQTTDTLLTRITEDLKKAFPLVQAWDTLYGINDINRYNNSRCNGASSYGAFFGYRALRMNHMAIVGMLIRAYLYQGDYQNALQYARFFFNRYMTGGNNPIRGNMVIYPYAAKSDYTGVGSNFKMKKTGNELVFGLSNAKLIEIVEDYYLAANEAENKGLSLANVDWLFENDGDDYRRLYLIEEYGMPDVNTGKNPLRSIKYRSYPGNPDNGEGHFIPNFRMTEAVYALIECEYRVGDKEVALARLNELRKAKGAKRVLTMDDISTLDELLDILVNDMARETLGEGQMFFTYKRLNRAFPDPTGAMIEPTDERMVFEIPQNQYVN